MILGTGTRIARTNNKLDEAANVPVKTSDATASFEIDSIRESELIRCRLEHMKITRSELLVGQRDLI